MEEGRIDVVNVEVEVVKDEHYQVVLEAITLPCQGVLMKMSPQRRQTSQVFPLEMCTPLFFGTVNFCQTEHNM